MSRSVLQLYREVGTVDLDAGLYAVQSVENHATNVDRKAATAL